MHPWEIVQSLEDKPEEVLSSLKPDDPFWTGASYAIDPFVGIIVRLPLRNPPVFGRGVPSPIFDKIAKQIISGNVRGDELVRVIEAFSRACTRDEWVSWYLPILRGELVLPISLTLYNKYAPHRIQPPALNKPKPISLDACPARFFVQPQYDGLCFWFVNTKDEPTDIRGYDDSIRRVRNLFIEQNLARMGNNHNLDIVITGYMTDREFLVEDLLTRDQFTRETITPSLERRLLAATQLGLPLVQMSDEFSGKGRLPETFWQELRLIQQQGYKTVLIRDLDGKYPFREQADGVIQRNKFAKLIRESA
jgi:hypothetical protein